MKQKILVMGLPGAGKTTLSQELVKRLMLTHKVAWFNADSVREQFNDWDFSPEGRRRQVERMSQLADASDADFAVCDFVCPTVELRALFNPDIIIWLDTIKEGRFEDTNKLFEAPVSCRYHVTDWSDKWVKSIVADLTKSSEPKDTVWRSVVKAYSYRICGSLTTVIISFLVTGSVVISATIGATELLLKPFVYWMHERVWTRINWGRR